MTGEDQERLAYFIFAHIPIPLPLSRQFSHVVFRRAEVTVGRQSGKEDTDAGRWTGNQVSPSGVLVGQVTARGRP